MDEGKHQEIELEQDLDNLYRKVASLDQTEDDQNQQELNAEVETPAEPDIQEPLEAQSAQEKERYKFHIPGYALGLIFTLFCLGMIGFFFWPGIYRHATTGPKGGGYPLRINRLTGETTYYNGKEWLRPPVPSRMIRAKAEEVKAPTVTALAAEEKERASEDEESPVVGVSLESKRGEYAIQIRAFPENKKQDAVTFLEDARKRMPDVSMETVPVAGNGVWHRILLGNFPTAEEAAEYRERHQLAREHPDSFIQRKARNNP